jgi:F-type H+-transporting ATPase subunit delta
MAEITTIARPYAEAIARVAREGNRWQAASKMLALIAGVAAEPQVAALVLNPNVTAEQVADVIVAICGNRLDDTGIGFVKLLAENKRIGSLPEIVRLFEELKAEQEGMVEAQIATAFPLSEAQLAALVAKLEAKFRSKVAATQEVDPTLIGGVVIRVGDEVMDASVRGKLLSLSVAIKN